LSYRAGRLANLLRTGDAPCEVDHGIIPRVDPELPFVDERAVEVAASAQATWDAVVAYASANARSSAAATGARVLGCRHLATSGSPAEVGATFPGWRVAESDPPATFAMEGEHRFSRYRLAFEVEELAPERVRLTAVTHAAFPGLSGSIYRGLVIGSRVHVLAVRRMLGAIERRAER
jgi:hypothetical protein